MLHPGAETNDIIEFYISMIKYLRIIDPQGVLLYRTADPIRAYLRLVISYPNWVVNWRNNRNSLDAIQLIVAQLVSDKSELAQEAQAPIVPEMEHEDYSDPKWIPEPPDAGPSTSD